MNLPKNIGDQDRNVRYVVGALLLTAGLFTVNTITTVVGLILIGTAYMRTCLAYVPFKFSSVQEGAAGTKEP